MPAQDNIWDQFQDLWVDSTLMTRHCLGIAATGGGKSNFLNLILKQQMMRGGGAIHIDGKNSKEEILAFLNLARQHDRWHDVRIINIDDASQSNTYNPLLRGDGEELASRIMMLIPEGGGDSYFRSQASRGIGAICSLARRMNMPVNFQDLVILMGNEQALRWLAQNAPKDTPEYKQFRTNFFDQLQELDRRTGAMVLSERKLQHTFGDIGGKLSAYTTGEARMVLNSYNPEVDILNALKENLLVYVALPMLSKQNTAIDFAKFFISDLRTAIGSLQNEKFKPAPTFLALMDEFSSYAMSSLAPVFEQARSANVSLFPFIQTISSLTDKERGLSPDFANKILGNTWNKISFVLQDPESCKVMSEIAGESLKETVSQSFSENIAFAGGEDDTSMLRTGGRGRSHTESKSMSYEAIVRPEEFRTLGKGEAIYIGRQDVLKIQVPLLTYDNSNKSLDFPRFRMLSKQGLDMEEKYGTFNAGG